MSTILQNAYSTILSSSSIPSSQTLPIDSLATYPFTTLRSVLLTTLPFLGIWRFLQHFDPQNTTTIPKIIRYNSLLYAVFSLVLGVLIFNSTTFNQISGVFPPYLLAYTYHVSKFYEYLDVFFLVASGHPIGPHMAFHHTTTPYLTFFRTLRAGQWEVFAVLNTVHHFFMYAYFGGVSVFRRILPWTGALQLMGGILLDLVWLRRFGELGGSEVWCRGVGVLLLSIYAVLFVQELREGSAQKKKTTIDVLQNGEKKMK